MRNEELVERGRQEFEARDKEAKGQVLEYARGWGRAFRAMAESQIKYGGGCLCRPACAPDADELAHTNMDCPVLIYLRLARLIVEDAERRCLPG
jgi:hypothetical protein